MDTNRRELFLKKEMRRHNVQLADAAKEAGVFGNDAMTIVEVTI